MLETIAPECVAIDVRYEFCVDGLFSEKRECIGEVVDRDRLLFSAKESVFKAWNCLANQWLDFSECTIQWGPSGDLKPVGKDLIAGTFVAHLSRSWSSSRDIQSRDAQSRFEGRFVFGKEHHLATMVTVDRSAGR